MSQRRAKWGTNPLVGINTPAEPTLGPVSTKSPSAPRLTKVGNRRRGAGIDSGVAGRSDRIGALPHGGGWFGTVSAVAADGEVRVARVTQLAPTERAALAAARRWYDRPEDDRIYAWIPSPAEEGLYRVGLFVGRRLIELEPVVDDDSA